MLRKITIGLAFAFGFTSFASSGETWRKETFESGEIVYHSGYWNAFNSQILIGERGVALAYMSPNGKASTLQVCTLSIDGAPEEKCEFESKTFQMFKNPTDLANRLANAKTLKLKVRVCGTGACFYAINGGKTEEINWEWNEPLLTTFPDFNPYKLK